MTVGAAVAPAGPWPKPAPMAPARWRRKPGVRDLLVVLTTYVAMRAVCLAAFALGSATPGARSVTGLLAGWDGRWYLRVARGGYPSVLPLGADGGVQQNELAFFPLYPGLLRALHTLGLPYLAAAQLVDIAAGSAAVALMLLVLRTVAPALDALWAVVLWCAWPSAYALSLTYTEALFCALAAGCLLALLRERWAVAGLLALLASATRPTGLVLALSCLAAAVVATRRGGGWRPWVAVALAPWGALGYLGYVAVHTGSAASYTRTESGGWGDHFDAGQATLRQVRQALLHPGVKPVYLAVAALLAISLGLAALCVRDRLPAPLLAYVVGVVVVGVTGGPGVYSAMPRLLLPAFPLLLPLVSRLRRHAPEALVPLAGLSAVLIGASAVVVTASGVIIP